MSKKIQKKYALMLLILAVAALALSISMACVLYFNHNSTTQLTDGVMHTVIMALIAPVFASLGVAAAMLVKKKTFIEHEREGKMNVFSSVSCIIVAIVGVILSMSYMLGSYADPLKDLLSQTSKTPYYSNLLSVVLAFCVSLVMAFMVFSKKGPYSPVRQLPLLVFAMCYGVRLHTDMSNLLMNTRRMVSVLAVCMLLLFITAKIRVLCYKSAQTYYIVSGFLAVGALAVSGFSGVMLNILGAASDGIQLWFYAYELALAIYVFAELFKYSYEARQEDK